MILMAKVNPQYIILHHTAAEEKSAEQIKQYHLSLGWRDIGYNYVIEKSGRVVKGRSLEVEGAHTAAAGMNHKSIGIAVIGDLEQHPPNGAQTKALIALLKELTETYHIPPSNVLGHNEVEGAHTLCPGKFFPWDEIRRSQGEKLYRVQVGAFKDKENALKLLEKLKNDGYEGFIRSN
jgi:N-acetyl-anhydromuramyl-L-alanine amidase AmpD